MSTENKPDDCREEFEKAADDEGFCRVRKGNGYMWSSTDNAWYGFQLAWNLRQPHAKALTESDCIELAKKLQAISERIANEEHPEPFKTRAEADAAYEKCKHLEIEAHAQAIHAALPTGQSAEVERLRGLLGEAVEWIENEVQWGEGAAQLLAKLKADQAIDTKGEIERG